MVFADNSVSLLNNSITGYIIDADSEVPGDSFRDSVMINLEYPDGSGNMMAVSVSPDALGNFAFTGVPIGNHIIQIINQPDNDTIQQMVSITPGSNINLEIRFPADLW
jgi:hypothetical protein